jgi:hypothetical protein
MMVKKVLGGVKAYLILPPYTLHGKVVHGNDLIRGRSFGKV